MDSIQVVPEKKHRPCKDEGENELFETLKGYLKQDRQKEFESLLNGHLEVLLLQDDRGDTLLHLAADQPYIWAVRLLIDKNADPNVNNELNEIPLHKVTDGGDGCHCALCISQNVECMEMLLEANSNMDDKDSYGDTPLANAATCLMPSVARVLWEKGADLNSKNNENEEVGVIVSKFIPEEVQKWLRNEIKSCQVDSQYLELNFQVLFRASGFDGKETTFLSYMNKSGRKARDKLLFEPLIQAYLALKWKAVGKIFFALRFAYLILVMIYTCFIFSVYLYNCPYQVMTDDSDDLDTSPMPTSTVKVNRLLQRSHKELIEDSSRESEDGTCDSGIWIYLMASPLIIFVLCMVLNEVYEMFHYGIKYLSIGLNYYWWAMIVTVSLNILPVFVDMMGSWQYPVAAFGLFLSWAMFLSQLARHPIMGVYVEMLGSVINLFILFAMTYTVLFVGFACGFIVLFPDNGMFETEYGFLPFFKNLLIMNGETDYETLFDEAENPRVGDLGYSIGAHIIFAGFIIIVTIILMNLLLGLAVSDIQQLQTTAELSKTKRLIEQIDLLETFFHSSWMPASINKWYKQGFSIHSQCLKYSDTTKCNYCNTTDAHEARGVFRFCPLRQGKVLNETLTDQFLEYLNSFQCINSKGNPSDSQETTFHDLNGKMSEVEGKLEMMNNNIIALLQATKQLTN